MSAHLGTIHKAERAGKRNATGVAGIAFFAAGRRLASGATAHFFAAFVRVEGKKRCRKFCVETLGRAEAWRRAVAARAEWEASARLESSSSSYSYSSSKGASAGAQQIHNGGGVRVGVRGGGSAPR